MTESINFRNVPMSIDEVSSLKRDLRRAYITGFLIGLMVLIIGGLLGLVTSDGFSMINIFIISGLFIMSIYLGIYFTKNLRSDIKNGIKELRDFEIIDKVAFEDDDPGKGGLKAKYHLVTKHKTFSVDKEFFIKSNISDIIVEHTAPLTGELLKIEII
jgi:hypothetical protein